MPNKTRLTDSTIKAIKPLEGWTTAERKRGYRLTYDADFTGLAIRTTAAGVKSFTYQYRNDDGQSRRVTLGRWGPSPLLTATAARQRAKKLRAGADTGGDPAQDRRARRNAPTFAALVEKFAAEHLSKKRSGAETARLLRSDAVPELGRKKACDVRRADVRRLIRAKAETAPVAANRLLSAVSRMYNWAIDEEEPHIEVNPVARMKQPREASRDRVLSEAEIRTVWEKLDTAQRIGPNGRAALKLILLTLARPGEVCGMRWSEIEGDTWELPAERSKNGKAHRVTLTELAREVIAGQPREGEHVFPSNSAAGHLQRMTLSQGVRRSLEHFGLNAPWKPHDLRRTAASQIAALGVSRFVIERLLNHSDRTVTQIYDRYEYSAEKRQALEKWARKLGQIIGQPQSADVVAIR